MVLHVDSDAVYITMPESIMFSTGHFYLIDWPSPNPIKHNPKINGPIHTECKTIRNFLYSAAEVESCENFNSGKKVINMKPALIILDHKKPAKPIKSDNYTT